MSMSPWADETASSSTSPPQLDTENGRSIKGAGIASAALREDLQRALMSTLYTSPEHVTATPD